MPRQVIFKHKNIRIFFTAILISTTGFIHAQTMNPVPASTSTPAPTPAKQIVIVVDAGHGGKDGSTRGQYSKEKDVALRVALELGENIQREILNSKVIYTRTEDVFIPLYERIDIANRAHADLFISIHCNSMPSTMRSRGSVNGVETFVSGSGRLDEQDVAIRENASILLENNYKENYEGYNPNDPESFIILSLMKNRFRRQSIKFATLIQNHYISAGRVNRGVKEQSLAVLAKAGMPAVLTEIGFISNPEEEDYMNSPEGRKEIVQNLTSAIIEYKNQILINPTANP